jgi:nucleotide-binding universal stress UspA family protein
MTTSAPPKVGFERILVPIDFTDISGRALEYAKSIARLNHSELVLAHATEPFNPVTPAEVVWFGQLTVDQPEQEQLDNRTAELHSQGFRARAVTLTGAIQEEILGSAAREKADLIVLGTHGRTGVPRFLFGSEAEAMYRHAASPIVVIGPSARPAPKETWKVHDVVCACDLDPASAPTAAYAHRLAQELGATFAVLCVDDSDGKASRELLTARFEQALEPLLIGGPKPNVLWRTLMIGYNLGSTIADVAMERNTDLIVMGAHPANHSTTHMPRGNAPQAIAKAPCPVMVVHT